MKRETCEQTQGLATPSLHIVVACAILLLVFGTSAAEASPADLGPFPVGTLPVGNIPVSSDIRSLYSEKWIDGEIYLDGQPYELPPSNNAVIYYPAVSGGGELPLIVYGHGFRIYDSGKPASNKEDYKKLSGILKQIASWGYVIISVDLHWLTPIGFGEDALNLRMYALRDGLNYMMDQNCSNYSRFYRRISPRNIAAMGHSMGALAALRLANMDDSPVQALAMLGPATPSTELAGLDEFGERPKMIIYGTLDPMITLPGFNSICEDRDGKKRTNPACLFDWSEAPKYLVSIDEGNHFGFTDDIVDVPLPQDAGPDIPRLEEQGPVTAAYLAAFFGRYLHFPCYADYEEYLVKGATSFGGGSIEDADPSLEGPVTPCMLPRAYCLDDCGRFETISRDDGLELPNRYLNHTDSPIQMTLTMNDNLIFGPRHDVGPPITIFPFIFPTNYDIPPVFLEEGIPLGMQDLVVIETTSDITGETVLDRCKYEVLVGDLFELVNVDVRPVDSSTGGQPMILTFSAIDVPGFTALATSSNGPPPPRGFAAGEPPTYYEVTTEADYSGSVKVCISYGETVFGDTSRLTIFSLGGSDDPPSSWVDRTSSLVEGEELICGEVEELALFSVFENVNNPPVAVAGPDMQVECACNSPLGTQVSLDGSGSSDPDGDPLEYSWTGPFVESPVGDVASTVTLVDCYPGDNVISLAVTDGLADPQSDSIIASVVDTTAPEIDCGAMVTIVPPDAPVSFIAAAADNCASNPSIEITAYDCFKYTKKGRRVDKTESCVIGVEGDSITILDSGGVGDQITWTVRASDSFGNFREKLCQVKVVNPDHN